MWSYLVQYIQDFGKYSGTFFSIDDITIEGASVLEYRGFVQISKRINYKMAVEKFSELFVNKNNSKYRQR